MKKYLIILILAIIAFGNAVYLSYEAYQFWNGPQAGILQSLPCDLSDHLSCSGILQNERGIVFSIGDFRVAFPMIAMVVYPIIFLLALSGWIRKTTLEAKWLTGLALGGMMFNGYIIFQEYIISVFCPLCAMCTLIITITFVLSICIWKGGK